MTRRDLAVGDTYVFNTLAPQRYLNRHNGKVVKIADIIGDPLDGADVMYRVDMPFDDTLVVYAEELEPIQDEAEPAVSEPSADNAAPADVWLVIDIEHPGMIGGVFATRALAEDYAQQFYSPGGDDWSKRARISQRSITTH